MKRILIIDDEESLLSTVSRALRKQGYETLEAADGEGGLRVARAELPDLVVSDVNMRGLDGFGVLRELRAQPATCAIPVILMTGAAGAQGMRQGMEQGADDYLPKPFAMEALGAAVRARLDRQEAIQAQAKANETRLLDILSATQDLIAIADAENSLLWYLNAAGRKMLGVRLQEDVSRLGLAGFCADAPSAVAQAQQIAEAKRDGVWVGESVFVSRDGRSVPVSKQIVAHRSRGGEIAYLSVVARDVTERRMMEVQLRQAQKLEAIGQLAAGIAHEINTPTQYVGDNTRFFRDSFQSLQHLLQNREELIHAAKTGALTPDIIARAEEMSEASDLDYLSKQIPVAITESLEGIDRISKIVRAMKEFSHPGGKEKCCANLNHAIETTLTVARNEWKYVATLQLKLDPALPPVPCYLGELNQAILNLVVNAAHAIGDAKKDDLGSKGVITVQTCRIGDHVEIRVSDTGTGIPVAIRSRIFEPFFTTKEVGKGTGQGLSIVYTNVVKKHAGTVSFESEVDKGTTFIIRLPITAPSVSSEKQGKLASITSAAPERSS